MNWAIVAGTTTDYIPGDRTANAKDAESFWRKLRHLHFTPVQVRQTTADEDRRLALGLHPRGKKSGKA